MCMSRRAVIAPAIAIPFRDFLSSAFRALKTRCAFDFNLADSGLMRKALARNGAKYLDVSNYPMIYKRPSSA